MGAVETYLAPMAVLSVLSVSEVGCVPVFGVATRSLAAGFFASAMLCGRVPSFKRLRNVVIFQERSTPYDYQAACDRAVRY